MSGFLIFWGRLSIITHKRMGASYNGSTLVSKTNCVGSIPAAPAEEQLISMGCFFLAITTPHEVS